MNEADARGEVQMSRSKVDLTLWFRQLSLDRNKFEKGRCISLAVTEGRVLSNTHRALTTSEESPLALVMVHHIHSMDKSLLVDGEGLHDLKCFSIAFGGLRKSVHISEGLYVKSFVSSVLPPVRSV